MHVKFQADKAHWLISGLMILAISACNLAQSVPMTQIVEVTRIVPVTVVVQAPPVEVTRIVLAAPLVEVTRIVIVEAPPLVVTQLVEVAPTEAAPAIAPTMAPAPTSVPPVQHVLLASYDFEGDFLTSGVVADRSGNGYDAYISGSVDVSQGIANGQAISLSGNGYLQALGNPAAGRRIVSFSLWFKTDHPESNYKLASAAWWNGGPGSGWILATHIPEFWSDDTQSLYLPGLVNNDNHFPAGEWVYEVVTYDGHFIREYTNGQLVNEWTATGAAMGQGQAMVIGAWPPYSGFNFQGSIDEFQVFDWALTAEEIQGTYDQRR